MEFDIALAQNFKPEFLQRAEDAEAERVENGTNDGIFTLFDLRIMFDAGRALAAEATIMGPAGPVNPRAAALAAGSEPTFPRGSEPVCGLESAKGYHCSRFAGHSGNHVALAGAVGAESVCDQWGSEPTRGQIRTAIFESINRRMSTTSGDMYDRAADAVLALYAKEHP